MDLQVVKDIGSIVAVVVGVASLAFTAFNSRMQLLTNRARFWLDLRDRFARHDAVHMKLKPGGAWAPQAEGDASGPDTLEDRSAVEAYMGLFEHCEVMLAQGLIDQRTFEEIYGYRLSNMLANRFIVVDKLTANARGWARFHALLRRLDLQVPRDV